MIAFDTVTFQKTPWEFDPHWLRVEGFDPNGDSLGVVTFEPNGALQPVEASSGVRSQMSRMSASLRSMLRRLRPSATASSALS